MSDKAPGYNTALRAVIDHTAFPHLIDMIFDYTTYDEWVVLRQTSREYRTRMEALMCRHVLVQDEDLDGVKIHVFTTPLPQRHERKRIPCLSLEAPFRKRTLRLLSEYTRVLDDDTLEVDTNRHSTMTARRNNFRSLEVHRGNGYGSIKVKVSKTIQWRELPSLMAANDYWHDYLDEDAVGLGPIPHQVHCYQYDHLSIVFPPYTCVNWEGAESMVFIFDGWTSDGERAAHLQAHMENHRSDGGRAHPRAELCRLLTTLGLGPERIQPLSKSVKITFVGLDKLIVLHGSRHVDEEEVDPNERIRRQLQRKAAETPLPHYSALLQQILEQSEFITEHEYALRVGYEQYEFETNRTV